ncbi:hypothetical protein H6F89_29130 [Cyanobacteria bacterium FACHB-63]|nr:hypothetical protein [Cyanobacteria bacterium FACHB-63]
MAGCRTSVGHAWHEPKAMARDYERLPETLAGLHLIAFAALMVKRFVEIWFQSA